MNICQFIFFLPWIQCRELKVKNSICFNYGYAQTNALSLFKWSVLITATKTFSISCPRIWYPTLQLNFLIIPYSDSTSISVHKIQINTLISVWCFHVHFQCPFFLHTPMYRPLYFLFLLSISILWTPKK